jgi:hypothetical protein
MLYYPEHLDVETEPSYVVLEIIPTGQPVENHDDVYAEFLKSQDSMLQGRSDEAEIVSQEMLVMPFGSAIELVIKDEFDGRPFTQIQYFLVLDDYVGFISATDFDDGAEGVAEFARLIANTIVFNNLDDIPPPELPPSQYGGAWEENVFVNEALGLRLELPQEGWTPLTREMVVMFFGVDAEANIQAIAASDQEQWLQVLVIEKADIESIPQFLQGFVTQMDMSSDAETNSSEVTQIDIAGHTYYTNAINAGDGTGGNFIQESFARELDTGLILTISFIYTGDGELDAQAFLKAALGE